MYHPLPIGIENFEEIYSREFYYIDKTLLVKELMDKGAKVSLFTRPRRFGKTLTLSMLQYYFEDAYDVRGNNILLMLSFLERVCVWEKFTNPLQILFGRT